MSIQCTGSNQKIITIWSSNQRCRYRRNKPSKYYSRADKTYNFIIKLLSEQLKSYDSFSMPCTINITKHKNWSQLFQHRYGQCNRCIIGSKGSEKCATIFRAEKCMHHVPLKLQFLPTKAPSAVVCSWWWAKRCVEHVQPHVNVK
jgi:hypothetical protein